MGIRSLAGQIAILDGAGRKAIVLMLSIVRFELAALTNSWCLAWWALVCDFDTLCHGDVGMKVEDELAAFRAPDVARDATNG